MKYIILILTLIISLNFNAQTDVRVLDLMVEGANTLVDGDDSSGVIGLEAFNENNSALVYQYKILTEEIANNFKNNSFNYKDYVINNQSLKTLSRQAVKANIIVKWRYFYKGDMIKEIIVYPNEWND